MGTLARLARSRSLLDGAIVFKPASMHGAFLRSSTGRCEFIFRMRVLARTKTFPARSTSWSKRDAVRYVILLNVSLTAACGKWAESWTPRYLAGTGITVIQSQVPQPAAHISMRAAFFGRQARIDPILREQSQVVRSGNYRTDHKME